MQMCSNASHPSFKYLVGCRPQVLIIVPRISILEMILRLLLIELLMTSWSQHKNNLLIFLLRWLALASNLHKGKSYIVQTNCHMQQQEAHMMNARQKLTFHKFKTGLTIPFILSSQNLSICIFCLNIYPRNSMEWRAWRLGEPRHPPAEFTRRSHVLNFICCANSAIFLVATYVFS
jgi:hypothetical protein